MADNTRIPQTLTTIPKKSIILDSTMSPCSNCFRITPATIIEENGKVFLDKECCEKEHILLENDGSFYKDYFLPFLYNGHDIKLGENRYSENVYGQFVNNFSALTINITSRCNMSCPICCAELSPSFFPRRDFPLEKIYSILKRRKSMLICISGGEPTLRSDLPDIIEYTIKSGNIPELYTNGLKLCEKEYVRKLKKSGLRIVNLSFDGFDDFAYQILRGEKLLKRKLKALKNLKEEKIQVFLTTVIGKNLNEAQVKNILEFACQNNDFIKGIRFNVLYPRDERNERFTLSDIVKIIESDFHINRNHFIESKRFFYNIYSVFGKFSKKLQKKFSYLVQNILYLKVKDGYCKPLFSLEYLKKFNSIIENANSQKNKLKTMKAIIKSIPELLNTELLRLSIISMGTFLNFPKAAEINKKGVLIIKIEDIQKARLEDLRRKFCGEAGGIFLEPKY